MHRRGQDHPELITGLAEVLPVNRRNYLHLEPLVDTLHDGVELDRHDLARRLETALDV